ncbi:MAG: cytochrome P460 family protein [Gammaproteobacteria bacterium]|nr:cytochrome P460 family protein [Gammaproteobacteria bacterium]
MVLGTAIHVMAAGGAVPAAPNGIELPKGYKDWRVIGSSYRSDKKQLRVIVGNDTAVQAARAGNTHPWPDGAILAKLAWKEKVDEHWPTALVPGDFAQAEFMVKDAKKYAATGGWGYARWVGMDQKPYGKDANFVQECLACHTAVKNNDWMFTHPAPFP